MCAPIALLVNRRNGSRCSLIATENDSPISAVDLFCGAGGLTHGLSNAGIQVEAGIDIDTQAEYAYRRNNPGSMFLCWDLDRKYCPSIGRLFRPGKIRLLAGCAPCQPFSKLTNGSKQHSSWDLLDNFGRFVQKIRPELVTMENVPELCVRGCDVFQRFIVTLEKGGYHVDWELVKCQTFGVPQARTRLVVVASRLGSIEVPCGRYRSETQWTTVRDAVSKLKPLASGESSPQDPLHAASRLSEINLRRIRATPHDGGTRRKWPKELVLACHRRKSGQTFGSVYGRMRWDSPAPTMTTLCTGLGNGRFGHPEQDRAISLREAAIFQSFPQDYRFWPPNQKLNRRAVGRMIGNAVPPKLAEALGAALLAHVRTLATRPRKDD